MERIKEHSIQELKYLREATLECRVCGFCWNQKPEQDEFVAVIDELIRTKEGEDMRKRRLEEPNASSDNRKFRMVVKEQMEIHNLSVYDIALMAKMNVDVVRDWMRGEITISVGEAGLICWALGINFTLGDY